MITENKNGGRTIELFLPFKLDGKRVTKVTFDPIRYDHTLRWQAGEWKTLTSLMAQLANVEEKVIRQIAYPDIERVMASFLQMLPPEIRDSLGETQQPVEPVEPYNEPEEIQQAINGAEQPMPAEQPVELFPDKPKKDPNDPRFQMDIPEEAPQPTLDELGLGVNLDG